MQFTWPPRRRRYGSDTRRAVDIAWLAVPMLLLGAPVAWAQDSVTRSELRPAPGDVAEGYVCPPVPSALIKHKAATGAPPPPSPEDLAVYQSYVALLQANDWAYLCRYRDENRFLKGGPRPRVVLLGDSITENWKPRDPELFTDGIIDRGIGGQTTPQMLLRFYADVIVLRPRVVHIMAGTNDIAGNTGPTSDVQFQDAIRAMVDLARAHDIKVILASIPPAIAFPNRPELQPASRIRAWNRWLSGYAKEQGLVFVDYYAVLTNSVGGLRTEFGIDTVHPSHAGYRPMDQLFKRALTQAERR